MRDGSRPSSPVEQHKRPAKTGRTSVSSRGEPGHTSVADSIRAPIKNQSRTSFPDIPRITPGSLQARPSRDASALGLDAEPIITEEQPSCYTPPQRPPRTPSADLGLNPGNGFRHIWPKASSTPWSFRDLPNPRHSHTVDASTIRYRFNGRSLSESQEKEAKAAIRAQLHAAGVEVSTYEPVFRFLLGPNRGTFLDLRFRTEAMYYKTWPVRLTWQDRHLELHSAGVPLRENVFFVIVGSLRTNANLPKFRKAFRERFTFDLTVTDMFADFTVGQDKTRSFNGSVAFLATYQSAANGNAYIPGWMNFEDMELPLYFRGRGKACRFCRTKSHPRHEPKDCTFRPCRRCNKTGHPLRLCPMRPVAREGAQQASSARPHVFYTPAIE
ncbi:uncharacterized protein PAN0_007d3349 [Moesziomyces antarcticus]|uniref:Uncharacterized protein n=2 Tax=Pseudozyma antarctica TaxID=84753 RepID=A0A081CEN6_PSEA2|nr:uncharacterized protein PAN0_007d3349 [Moesziomyces antarcticus]GAK65132.1 hypothetical protein PAN0_007d3349 [Moesziomyces antarcticus]SPO45878.1 uncharacterized protein PSANT_03564 [Moesziomyces antarcticus]